MLVYFFYKTKIVTGSFVERRVAALWTIQKCRQTKTPNSLCYFDGALDRNIASFILMTR